MQTEQSLWTLKRKKKTHNIILLIISLSAAMDHDAIIHFLLVLTSLHSNGNIISILHTSIHPFNSIVFLHLSLFKHFLFSTLYKYKWLYNDVLLHLTIFYFNVYSQENRNVFYMRVCVCIAVAVAVSSS